MLIILTLLLLLLVPLVSAVATWHVVRTNGNYRPREEVAFTICGPDLLCLLGGRGANHADVLNTTTMTWTQGSTNPLEMNHFQAIQGPDSCAWVAGAWKDPFPYETVVPDIWRYCPLNDSWSVVDRIERPRGAGATVFHEGILYLVSGNVGGHNADARVVPWFDAYNPATGEWTQLEDVPRRTLALFFYDPFFPTFPLFSLSVSRLHSNNIVVLLLCDDNFNTSDATSTVLHQ